METIVNYNLLNNKKKYKFIFITEKKNYISYLANKIKAEIVEHKNYIGSSTQFYLKLECYLQNLIGLNEKKFKKFNELIKIKIF